MADNTGSKRYKSATVENTDPEIVSIEKITAGFLASFIHSLDAAIMRLIILEINEKSSYIVNPLPDSVQPHPNKYLGVAASIEKVYTENAITNALDNLLLRNLRDNLADKHLEEFDSLVRDLKSEGFEIVGLEKRG